MIRLPDRPFWGLDVSEAFRDCVCRTSLMKCLILASTSWVGKCICEERGRGKFSKERSIEVEAEVHSPGRWLRTRR